MRADQEALQGIKRAAQELRKELEQAVQDGNVRSPDVIVKAHNFVVLMDLLISLKMKRREASGGERFRRPHETTFRKLKKLSDVFFEAGKTTIRPL